jgi:hypothetical protein
MFFHRRIELIVKFSDTHYLIILLDILDISFMRFNERQVGRQLGHIVI